MSWALAEDPAGSGPLAGLRVLEFATLLPVPFATQILADLGADVVKVEAPRGDDARRFPSGLYQTANRNKRAIVVDLKTAADRGACLQLAAEADVVFEGFRPGVADRIGIGYEAIRAVRADIVYCSVSGYGRTGPNAQRPGHDLVYLAAAGGLAFSGHWGEPARRSGVPVGDMAGATYAVIAVLAALQERARTGVGCDLDVAIADAAMAFVSPRGGPQLALRDDARLAVYPTNEIFTARDDVQLAISAVEEKFWSALRGALLECEPALADPRFDDETGRREHGDELKALIARAFSARDGATWLQQLTALDVPVERVATLDQAASGAQATARGIVQTLDGERHVVFPVLRSGAPLGRLRSVAPPLGAHSATLLPGGVGDREPALSDRR
jgi:CoA:oxalate CoA-transferase